MRVAFLINDFASLVATQTTAMLIAAAAHKQHTVYVLDVTSFSLTSKDSILAQARQVKSTEAQSLEDMLTELKASEVVTVDLAQCDVLMIRTNPARDQERQWAHSVAMTFARIIRARGVLVLNDPDGLMMASNKLYLSCIPQQYRPTTFVSRDRMEIRHFVDSLDARCVLKPLQGSRGRDVFFVGPNERTNLNQIIDVLTRDGIAMVQEFVPEATSGDIRLVVMDGEILEHQGAIAAIAREPAKGDIRSNLHAGGKAKPPIITEEMRQAVKAIGPQLVKDGLFLVGLDFIGNQIIELNVFSTGGFRDAERFTGQSFSDMVIDAMEKKRKEMLS